MKKIIFVLCMISGLAACNTKDAGSPKATIDAMFTAMKNGNIEEMKKFITKTDVSLMEALENYMTGINPEAVKQIKEKMITEMKEQAKKITYSIKNEKIDGDNATVETEVVENGKTSSHNLSLVKEDGAWKIALTKPGNDMFNSMKGNMGPDNLGPDDAIKKIKSIPPDSLKMMIDSFNSMMKKH